MGVTTISSPTAAATRPSISALVVLKRRDDWEGHFSVPAAVPVLGACVCLAMLTQALAPELMTAGILLLGIVALYLIVRPSAEAIEKMEV